MYQPRSIVTEHRRKRLTLWALAVLGWLAGILFGDREATPRHLAQRVHHVWLEDLTCTTITLLLARALQLANARIPRRVHEWRRGRSLRRTHFMRSLLGARLRRLLKHKDLAARIAQLSAVLRDLDAHAAHLAKRLSKLQRIWRIPPPIALATVILGPPAPSPAFSNSS